MDLWTEGGGFVRHADSLPDVHQTLCCPRRSPLLGKSVTASVMGIPPYITVDPKTKVLWGSSCSVVIFI
jgi:hypothetical protein